MRMMSQQADAASTDAPGLPVFTVTAKTNYDLGFAIGKRFRSNIAAAFEISKPADLLHAHPQAFANYLAASTKAFPHLVDELRGTADGAQQPFDLVAAALFSDELGALGGNGAAARVDHCSDFMYSPQFGNATAVIAHNEDGNPEVFNMSYFVNATLGDLSFMAFTYAGALPTSAFGFNGHGVYFSDNALFPLRVSTKAGVVPQSVLHRASLEQPSVDAVVALLQRTPCASGFNYNLADAGDPGRLEGVEVAPEGRVSAYKLDGNEYCHFNMYRRLAHAGENDTSSEHRMARAKQVGSWDTVAQVRAMIGDTKDTRWPIFRRSATDADGIETLASAVFDASAATLSVYRANPKTALPVYVFPVPRGAPTPAKCALGAYCVRTTDCKGGCVCLPGGYPGAGTCQSPSPAARDD